jgi:hypothetical protein
MSCTSCKKKKPVTELPPVVEEQVYAPTKEEIKLAYAEFSSILGVKEDKKELVSKVYQYLFNEELRYKCKGCGNSQARRFHNFMKTFKYE